ncbi:MAG: hypothetical protein KF799_12880 [Bdellovibrionales bacterium]|nr:hypothetical protein [Bdellovibrionales bacterium]
MRFSGALALVLVLILSSCGPAGKRAESRRLPKSSTGFYKEPGVDYITNDPYVKARLAEGPKTAAAPAQTPTPALPTTPIAKPATPAQQPTAQKPTTVSLKGRIKGFEIFRYAEGDGKKDSRLGTASYALSVFFGPDGVEKFSGPMKAAEASTYDLSNVTKRYALKGKLIDSKAANGKESTSGVFTLTDTVTHETVEISYRAEKTRVTMRRNADKAVTAGSSIERQLKAFCNDSIEVVNHCKNTFGWVNNWTVLDPPTADRPALGGPSFYVYDLFRVVKSEEEAKQASYSPPMFSMRGESLRTGGETDVYQYAAESLTPDVATDMQLIGNGLNGDRMFEAKLIDKDTKEENEFLIDFDVEAEPQVQSAAESEPDVVGEDTDLNSGGDDESIGPERIAEEEPVVQQQQQAITTTKAKATPPSSVGDAYLATDMSNSNSRAARLVRDLNQNRDIPAVRTMIVRLQKGQYARGGPWLPDVRGFFANTYPFRKMLKSIAKTFDISPAFAYLSAGESGYLIDGKYALKAGDGGKAVGAFQMHPAAAGEMGLPAKHRVYFAPASCAAARYLSGFVNQFWKGDTTVAILAYNQGGGGAKKLMEKSIKLGGKYAYKYSEMQKYSALSVANKDYVNRFLAVYFVASNMTHYKFDPRIPGAKTAFPQNGSVFPGGSASNIQDSTCRAAVMQGGASS